LTDFSARVYRLIFAAAAAYNIAFGLWASLFPSAFFRILRLDPPRYPAIWACLGMVVGLYGVGYAYAAWRLERAAPFIAIGLAGKILGPIGWTLAVRSGELPIRTFPLVVFDDLIWWIPFALFLLEGTAIAAFVKRTAPYWCVALHLVAAFGTLLLLRTHFRLMWILWMAAAISLVGFYAWWGSRIGWLLPWTVACAGTACDFAGESIYIGWMPPAGTPLDRVAALLTGGAGNGLYTLAGIMLTIASSSIPMRWLAWLAWTSGIALTVATIINIPMAVVVTSAALMIFFIPFVLVMARR
jgi:hypothetical protein